MINSLYLSAGETKTILFLCQKKPPFINLLFKSWFLLWSLSYYEDFIKVIGGSRVWSSSFIHSLLLASLTFSFPSVRTKMMCKQFLMGSHEKWQHYSHGSGAVKSNHVILWYGNHGAQMQPACILRRVLVCASAPDLPAHGPAVLSYLVEISEAATYAAIINHKHTLSLWRGTRAGFYLLI